MTKVISYRASLGVILFAARLLLAALVIASACVAQQPQLQISSPVDGAVVNPGQTILVTVTSPANIVFTSVAVAAEDPLDLANIATSVPAQFSLTIPTNIPCGKYMLTADGTTAAGQTVESAPILIDVEHSDPALGLSASIISFSFKSTGDQSSARIFATFGGNIVADATRSTLMSYTSSDATIATVDASSGSVLVTAVAPGMATITATYSQGTSGLPISIPVVVLPPLGASPRLLSFPGTPVGTSSVHQTVTLINSSKSSINILGVSAAGDFSQTSTCTSPLATEDTCSIDVVFRPSAVGARTGSVGVTSDSTPATLTIPLTGTGIRDFSISAIPATQTVTTRASTTYTASTLALGGFVDPVSLSVAGLPSGVTASFAPATISGGSGSSTLTVTPSSKASLGTFVLTITGNSATSTHAATVTLTVKK